MNPTDQAKVDLLLDRAEEQATVLMSTLYAIRGQFDPLHPIWHTIPSAQTTLERVRILLTQARREAQE